MTIEPGHDAGELLARLRALVGARVRFQGIPCLVADLILSPAMLILKPVDAPAEIQSDAYGRPRRRAPQFIEVPVFLENEGRVNPELRLLRPGDPE